MDKYGSSPGRLASAYEADPAKRRDLSQDIHFQLWRSFQRYDARCFLRTWTYRVARQVAVSYVMRERRIFSTLVSLEELEMLTDAAEGQVAANQRINLITLFGEERVFGYAGSNTLEFSSRVRLDCLKHFAQQRSNVLIANVINRGNDVSFPTIIPVSCCCSYSLDQ